MYKHELIVLAGMLVFLAVSFFINADHVNEKTEAPLHSPKYENNDQHKTNASSKIIWGVDSTSYTDESLFTCMIDNFGQPKIWGRYLGDINNVSAGLDTDEVNYLHSNDVHILIIYNDFTDATGYEHGVKEAKQAISFAEDLGIPEGVAIFGNIEPDHPVNSAFIDGWYDTLSSSVYVPALYGVFSDESPLITAYNATHQETQENIIIWTAHPQTKITTKKHAPTFSPQGPHASMIYGWQYAKDAKQCNINTNLFRDDILDDVW